MKRTLFCAALTAWICTTAAAQIRYADIAPDTVLVATLASPWANYELDLNGDANPDFTITQFHPSATLNIAEMSCSQYGSCEMLVDGSGTPRRLSKNDPIDSAQTTWFDSQSNAVHMSANWKNVTDGYLGLRVREGGALYYGWARLNVAADESAITVKDYACRMTPNMGIAAGAGMPTGVRDADPVRDIRIRVNGRRLTVEMFNHPFRASIAISDLPGRIAARFIIDRSYFVLDLSSVKPGMYFLLLQTPSERLARKFLLQ